MNKIINEVWTVTKDSHLRVFDSAQDSQDIYKAVLLKKLEPAVRYYLVATPHTAGLSQHLTIIAAFGKAMSWWSINDQGTILSSSIETAPQVLESYGIQVLGGLTVERGATSNRQRVENWSAFFGPISDEYLPEALSLLGLPTN